MNQSVLIIAHNTFREIIRDRILYGLILFSIVLLSFSLALGELSFAEQTRIAVNLGFAGMHLSLAVIAVFIGSSLVSKEIEKQTVLTLLVRPISRDQFILGKYLGLCGVMTAAVVVLALILGFLLSFMDYSFDGAFPLAVLGILFESCVLLAVALFFGTFAKPPTTIAFSLSIYLLGHWTDSLDHLVRKSTSLSFRILGNLVRYTVPDLNAMNWRDLPVYGFHLVPRDFAVGFLTTSGWMLLLLSLAIISFRRREFV